MASSHEDRMKIIALKEQAKWAENPSEMKKAVTELANYGEMAIPTLEEIRIVTVHEDVKSGCMEAIKKIRGEEQRWQPAERPASAADTSDRSPSSQKEGELEKERAKRKEKKEA